jgi:hypothetical protein
MMLYSIILVFLLWYTIPHILLYFFPIPDDVRRNTHLCWLKVTVIEILKLPVGLLSPIVVPIALLFTKWEDNKLPAIFWWWDNDISINGDEIDSQGRNAWALDYKENAYYAKAPPRSFWARYVWLGWRNRASKLSEAVGYKYEFSEFENRIILGDAATSRGHPGWKFVYTPNISQLMIVKKFGKICIRFNWGYKFFDKPTTMSVGITFSLLSSLKQG